MIYGAIDEKKKYSAHLSLIMFVIGISGIREIGIMITFSEEFAFGLLLINNGIKI